MNIQMDHTGEYQVTTTEDCTRIVYPGGTMCSLYQVVPGIILSLVHVRAENLPSMNTEQGACLYTINYAEDGVCEMQTEGRNYLYIKGGELCISRELPDQQFRYPTGSYDGIEVFLFESAADDRTGILNYCHIGIHQILDNYLGNGQATLIAERADSLESDFREIRAAAGDARADAAGADASLLRISCLHLLRRLTAGEPVLKPEMVSALTPAQLAMAEKARNILTERLDRRIPVRVIAEDMGISETSLKNYFRAVYGQNVSAYLLKERMEMAESLLGKSRLTIGEIASRTGYRGQSRFDDAFRRYTGMTPSEWRRRNSGNSG